MQWSPSVSEFTKRKATSSSVRDKQRQKQEWLKICVTCLSLYRKNTTQFLGVILLAFPVSSLGVHISFVRSIAMDSWTDKQLALMKKGGNAACNDYLKARGIDARTPIKAKYESDAAQLYKEVLKARVEGRPEPTALPPPKARAPASAPSAVSSISSNVGPRPAGGGDPNGMERLVGETDQQYIARQTRLKEEARARMQAKFGNSGGRMGGVGSSSMQGIGSNPNYNPNGGYGGPNLDSVVNSVSGAFSSGLSFVSSVVNDESTKSSVSNLASTATAYGGSFWGSLKSTVSEVAATITQPDEDDGLAALQREFHSHVPSQSKYAGFGSNSNTGSIGGMQQQPSTFNGINNNNIMGGGAMNGASLQEAPGLPGEDRNGVERLTGETDEQYVVRQTRLRDEAKARMAAKFGGGGLSSASSSAYPAPPSSYTPSRPAPAPSSGNSFGGSTPSSFPTGMALNKKPAPSPAPVNPSNNAFPRPGGMTPPRKNSKDSISGDDFFAAFGA
jgi:ADP-ribosylation factor GTPase-activating protein 1